MALLLLSYCVGYLLLQIVRNCELWG